MKGFFITTISWAFIAGLINPDQAREVWEQTQDLWYYPGWDAIIDLFWAVGKLMSFNIF